MTLKKRKQIKKDVETTNKEITQLYKELEKYSPSHIVADRIKSEINRLRNLTNDSRITLLSGRIFWMYILIGILLIVLVTSFFVKPQIQVNLTVTVVFAGVFIISLVTITTILLRHWLTGDDRRAKRERDIAEAEFLKSQIKK